VDIISITFYCYPKCGTCRNAKKWLDSNQIDYKEVHIVEQTPTKEQLQSLISISDLPMRKFFNTSGIKYRELGLKDKLGTATEDEILTWLASDGMLIKRPIITNGKQVTLGFKEEVFEENWK
jgi:arsenate reductase